MAGLFVRAGRAMRAAPSLGSASRLWAAAAGLAGITALAWEWRDGIQSAVQGRGGAPLGLLAACGNVAGSGTAVTAYVLASLVIGFVWRKGALLDTAFVLGVAGAWCWLLTDAGQFVLAERRPIEGGQMHFFALGGHGVSGHAAATALLAYPVRDVLLRSARPHARRFAMVFLAAWAVIVGWSRVWLGMHHAWNVLLGLGLGIWTSRAAVAAWQETATHEQSAPIDPGESLNRRSGDREL